MSRSLWPGIDPPTTRPRSGRAAPESTDRANVPYLFSVRNMFFSSPRVLAPFHGDWPLLKWKVAPFENEGVRFSRKLAHCSFRTIISQNFEGIIVAINFVPERGRILICNFDMARVAPENAKKRRVAVLSPRSYNERHGANPGRCVVVPFSVTKPPVLRLSDVRFLAGPYKALTEDTWATCDSVMAVSHARLDRVYIGHAKYSEEVLSEADLKKIEAGLRHAFGCPLPGD